MRFFKLNKKQTKSDDELLDLLRKTQDLAYFQELFQRYIPLAYGLCLKYLKNEQSAEDAVIDLYEDLAAKITRYSIDNFKNWLYSVVKNHCFAILKENRKEVIVNFDSNLMESDSIIDLLDDNNDEEKIKAVNECISQLPDPQRISILAFFFENKSYAEIVEATGFQLKSVKSYIQNGRRNLKICIEKKIKL